MDHKNHILYIDDNKDHLLIVKSMLKRAGYGCDTISNPQKGLDAALSGAYSLVLIDIQMPLISGIDMLEQLNARQNTKGYRLVAITANSSIFSNQNPYDMGFDGHLSKPIMPRDLTRLVEQMLQAAT